MKLTIMALIGAAAALTGCADYYPPPPPPAAAPVASLPPADCFRTHDIRNHTIGDERTLYLSVGGRDVYRVEMSGSCLAGVIGSDPIVMREPPGRPYVCGPIDLDISISRGGIATPCIPRTLVRLTPAEVEALPPRLRP